jgi:hypothetical protein
MVVDIPEGVLCVPELKIVPSIAHLCGGGPLCETGLMNGLLDMSAQNPQNGDAYPIDRPDRLRSHSVP